MALEFYVQDFGALESALLIRDRAAPIIPVEQLENDDVLHAASMTINATIARTIRIHRVTAALRFAVLDTPSFRAFSLPSKGTWYVVISKECIDRLRATASALSQTPAFGETLGFQSEECVVRRDPSPDWLAEFRDARAVRASERATWEAVLADCAWKFVIDHELGHVLHAHFSLVETPAWQDLLTRQTLEYDADAFAIVNGLGDCVLARGFGSPLQRVLIVVYVAMALWVLIDLQSQGPRWGRPHPPLGFRGFAAIATIDEYLRRLEDRADQADLRDLRSRFWGEKATTIGGVMWSFVQAGAPVPADEIRFALTEEGNRFYLFAARWAEICPLLTAHKLTDRQLAPAWSPS